MKIEWKYGLYTGIGICLWKMAEHVLGFNSTNMYIGQFTRTFAILLPIVMIAIGIREERDSMEEGEFTVYDGMKCGLTIATIYGTITAFFFFVYQTYINPDYVAHLIEFERLRMVGDGVTPADIPLKIDAMRTMNSFPAVIIFQFVGSVVSGLAISIVASAIVRRKKKPA